MATCTAVAPGMHLDSHGSPKDSAPDSTGAEDASATVSPSLCCFPYLTGNAVFPACSAGGVGMYQHVDVEHIVRAKAPQHEGRDSSSADTSAQSTEHSELTVAVVDLELEGWTGNADGDKVGPAAYILNHGSTTYCQMFLCCLAVAV